MLLDYTGGVRPTPIEYEYEPPIPWPKDCEYDFCTVDFETYYTSAYTLEKMSTWQYVNHQAFDAHTVALCIVRKDRPWKVWVGHPIDAPWKAIADLIWVSHNAGFDDLVHQKCINLEIIPNIRPRAWDCTADMASYLQAGRSLKNACWNLLGMEIDKSVREKMLNGTATAEEIQRYAGGDAVGCAELWFRYAPMWSTMERELSRMTRRSGWVGVYIDKEGCNRDIGKLEYEMYQIKKELPWAMKDTAASHKSLSNYCFKIGIQPPPNLDLDDEDTQQWVIDYSGKYEWVGKIREFTQCRQMVSTMRLFVERLRKNGTVPFDLLYCGAAATLRWQSGKKMRMQNLNKEEVRGVNIRHKIMARPGYKFVICDSSQIEPRVLQWFVNNIAFLDACSRGQSPYEAHARASMGYVNDKPLKKTDLLKYTLAKAQVLALGYQAAAPKFCFMAMSMCNLKVDIEQPTMSGPKGDSWTITEWDKALNENRLMTEPETYQMLPSGIDIVKDFRRNNPLIVNYWKANQEEMRGCLGGSYLVPLPSGRFIRYFNVRMEAKFGKPAMFATLVCGSSLKIHNRDFYGGKLVENRVQAFSREILGYFMWQIQQQVCWAIPAANARIAWSVHDEVIIECKEEFAEQVLKLVLHIMHTAPDFAKGLPVAAEGGIHDFYTK